MRVARGISVTNTSKPISTAIVYDSDAVAFFTAASITDTTQKNAVNQLVLDLKSASIWTKMKAIYPVVGGVASAHAVNLKTPGTYNLSFATGWTHASTGMTPNGATYADTNLTPSTALSLNSTHISFYSRTDNSGSWDIGCYTAIPNTRRLELICKDSNNMYYSINSGTESSVANTNGTGLYIANRTSSSIHQLIKNNTINSNTVSSVGLPTRTIFIGGGNLDGGNVYGSKQCAFSSIGDGLTDADASSFYTAVQTFQTTLGRQV